MFVRYVVLTFTRTVGMILAMPNDDDLYAKDFINTLKKKHLMGTYKSMVCN